MKSEIRPRCFQTLSFERGGAVRNSGAKLERNPMPQASSKKGLLSPTLSSQGGEGEDSGGSRFVVPMHVRTQRGGLLQGRRRSCRQGYCKVVVVRAHGWLSASLSSGSDSWNLRMRRTRKHSRRAGLGGRHQKRMSGRSRATG